MKLSEYASNVAHHYYRTIEKQRTLIKLFVSSGPVSRWSSPSGGTTHYLGCTNQGYYWHILLKPLLHVREILFHQWRLRSLDGIICPFQISVSDCPEVHIRDLHSLGYLLWVTILAQRRRYGLCMYFVSLGEKLPHLLLHQKKSIIVKHSNLIRTILKVFGTYEIV